MNGFALLLATALLGVDYGWQPASDGRLEYIIQLEPVTLIALREGQEVVSQIDPFVRDVRRLRIRVGTDVVPRLGTPTPEATAASPAAASAPPPGVAYGWQPVNAQQLELLVQIAPDRLAVLQNDPIVGEIPPELKNVARVRIRSGTAEMPRQSLAPAAVPAMPANPTMAGAGAPGPAAGGTQGTAAGAGAMAATAGAAAAANPASSWPATNRSPGAQQPSRYDPPGNAAAPVAAAPAIDSRAAAASSVGQVTPGAGPLVGVGSLQNLHSAWPPTTGANGPVPPANSAWQNPTAQNPTASWPASGSANSGGLSLPNPPTNQPPIEGASPSAGQGLVDPSGASQGWAANPQGWGTAASGPSAAAMSSGWGTPDDRLTTERGQTTGGNPPAANNASSAWSSMVPLPQGPTQPPSQAWPATPSPSSASWLSSFSASGSAGEMASPFAEPLTIATRPTDLPAAQTPWGSSGALHPVGFSGESGKKKTPDFWADLAEAANDPSLGFLRDTTEAPAASGDKPWWPLTLAMLALFASLGGNLYMGWIAVDVYRRYLEMADDGDEDEEDDDSSSPAHERRDWEDAPRRRERVAVED